MEREAIGSGTAEPYRLTVGEVLAAFDADAERGLTVAFSLLLQVAVVYVPFLQEAFSTVSLSGRDWLLCAATASSVLWLRELQKIVMRSVTQ
jgi:magnesium-transporting ATPase (P-type)